LELIGWLIAEKEEDKHKNPNQNIYRKKCCIIDILDPSSFSEKSTSNRLVVGSNLFNLTNHKGTFFFILSD